MLGSHLSEPEERGEGKPDRGPGPPTQVRRAFRLCASTASSALLGLGLIALGRHEGLGAGIIQVSDQKQAGCPFPTPQKERGRLLQARPWAVATDHFATGLAPTAT